MSAFVDTTLLRLSTATGLRDLVFPAADPTGARIRALFAEVYQLPYAAIHQVSAVDVVASACQQPLFPRAQRIGSWTQTHPAHTRTDFSYAGDDLSSPQWIDVDAQLAVTVVLAVDAGGLESFRIGDLGEFSTLEEFRAKFEYFDLDTFMREHQLSTVEDLKHAFRYLLGEVKLKPAGPFDPADPRNRKRFPLRVAVLVREVIDVAAALRDVRRVQATSERGTDYRRQLDAAEATAAYAPLLVFPAAAVPATGFTQAQLTEFFASQQTLAVFTSS